MSLKLIELQIALPRTQDAGKLQDQMNQRALIEQSHLQSSFQKKIDRQRRQVQPKEKIYKSRFNKDRNHSPNDSSQGEQDKKEVQQDHPYKGKHIDFSG